MIVVDSSAWIEFFCLIAEPTIEADATLLQADRDFEVLARHTPLRLEPV